MTHVRTLSLDPATDPIHAAIERHRAAIDAYRYAPSLATNDDLDAATDALIATACATRFGALALHDHLRWWLTEEAEFAAGYQPAYRLAQVRAADLTLFLGTRVSVTAIPRATPQGRLTPASTRLLPGVDRYRQSAPSALPNEPLPGEDEPWRAVAAVRPDTAHCRAPRFLDFAAEALAAVAIIAGGIAAYGFLPIA